MRFPSWLMVENLGSLLPKLVHLSIGDCRNCQKLPPLWKLPSLQSLRVCSLDFAENTDGVEEGEHEDKFMLPSTTPADELYFPSLKRLDLRFSSEKILKLILCPPPHHPSPLCNLNEDQEIMPEDVFGSLTSLRSLLIHECRNLVSLSTCLTHLTSLEDLSLLWCPMLDLSCEEALQFQVPPKLSTFWVIGLEKLMTLPVWLRHMSATLKSIQIGYCPNFTTIPEWIGELTALTRLKFYDCPKLTSITEGMRSLTTLQVLSIDGCSSRLKQRCDKEAGDDWPNIAHIPKVIID